MDLGYKHWDSGRGLDNAFEQIWEIWDNVNRLSEASVPVDFACDVAQITKINALNGHVCIRFASLILCLEPQTYPIKAC